MDDFSTEEEPRDVRERAKARRRKVVIIVLVILLCVIAFAMVLAFSFVNRNHGEKNDTNTGRFSKAAVATDVPECSEMGSSILQAGGSAVDSAITSMLCIGLVHGQSSGIGGGTFMLIYDREAKETKFIDARETAPAATTPDMFNSDPKSTEYGALAIATPGELKGMWEAHQKYGKLSWKELFEPVIALARKGFPVTNHTARALGNLVASGESWMPVSQAWKDVYYKDNGTRPKEYGDIVIRSNYADTLQRIANVGLSEFYSGHTADMIMQDINTYSEFTYVYKPKFIGYFSTHELLGKNLGRFGGSSGRTLHSRSSSELVVLILNVFKNSDTRRYNSYTNRDTRLQSTSLIFGCKIMSATTGIIYNNQMADFTIPNSEVEYQPTNQANYAGPNKRALSSMSGSILLDENGDVKLVIGSAGGKQIISANSWVTIDALATKSSLIDVIEKRRIHNQLFPNQGMYEAGFSTEVLTGLEDLGQMVTQGTSFAVVQAILKDKYGIEAHADSRKQGIAAGY
ncbi:glutathione hydrolase proenzyme-like [Anneissia japonica]|uniref:glutathione hydrolase proenzyme-like n=1 Tax=Anneissia japonica TaxID=1529436 RepID=UPI001425823B|nr:glutathione hydrolase proenzyme-like [Anneissia japonica]